MEKLLRDKKAIAVFILPALILYLIVVFVPIVWSIVYSLFSGMPGMDFKFTGLSNYLHLFKDADFINSVVTNLKYVGVVVTGQIGLGFLVSLLFVFGLKKYKTLIRTIVFFPVVLPTVATSQLFAKIYEIAPQYGLLNSLLHVLSLDSLIQPWLGQTSTALWALCVADIWKAVGLYALIFYGGLVEIPDETIESARLDGASGVRLVRHIILPLVKPVIITGLVLSLTGTIKAFDSVLALTAGGPGTSTQMISMYMYDTAFKYGQYGYGSAIAIFILFECLVATGIVNKLSKND